jgi:hypothetical protein
MMFDSLGTRPAMWISLWLGACATPTAPEPQPAVAPPTRVQRLTRAQIDRAASELLGVPVELDRWLPADAQTAGFDNTEDGLYLTPTFLTSLDAALRPAIDRATTPEGPWTVTASQIVRRCSTTRSCQTTTSTPPTGGSPGSAYLAYASPIELPLYLPRGGVHEFSLDIDPGLKIMPPILIDGVQVATVNDDPATLSELRFDSRELEAGYHVLTIAHLDEVTIHDLTITPPDTAPNTAHDALFRCAPGPDAPVERDQEGSWAACAEELLRPWLRRAWRRPATPEEVTALAEVVVARRADGSSFQEAMGAALESALLSPWFLFRIEAGEPTSRNLTQFELASRLAFFLHSNLPDDTLLSLAEAGALSETETLRSQVRRMLDEPARASFVSDFAGQWLQLRQLDELIPDPTLYPDFDDALREAMRAETERLVTDVFTGSRSLPELWTSTSGDVAPPLDALYGLDAPGYHDDLDEYGRGGLFGQAAWLAVTSHPNRTSIVTRGKTVLVSLLCESVGSPPPGVSTSINEDNPYLDVTSRATDPSCSSCHARMDPIGAALEGFDAIGATRVAYPGGAPITTTATLYDGTTIQGPRDLGAWVAQNERLNLCFARQVTTWAFGRALPDDHEAMTGALDALRASGGDVPTMLEAIATSDAFRTLLEAR